MPLAHILSLFVIVGAWFPASDATGWWRPSAGIAWDVQFAIDPEAELVPPPGPISAIDLDGGETLPATVDALHQRGIRALCYVNAGAWEEWRPDAGDYPDAIIGRAYPDWPGERFVDIRALTVLGPILEVRLDRCAALGFDAIELDNIDTMHAETGFMLTENDQLVFNRWLAGEAHDRGLAIFQKNIPELAADLVDTYDGAVTEDCAADGWCDDMAPYPDANKPVLAIEYSDVTDPGEFAAMCADRALGQLSLILKNRDLDASRVACDDPPVQATR